MAAVRATTSTDIAASADEVMRLNVQLVQVTQRLGLLEDCRQKIAALEEEQAASKKAIAALEDKLAAFLVASLANPFAFSNPKKDPNVA